MAKSEDKIREKVRELLVNAGVEEGDAGYLGELYAKSEKGREHQKPNPDPVILGSNCAVIGILPIG